MRDRVLVVDDDTELCCLLREGLTERGFDVVTRTSAEEGLADLAGEPFDVALSDVQMTGMDGIALCRWIVENRPSLPVVVMTAFANLDTAIAAIRAGAYDFVKKPLDLDALKTRLERAAAHYRVREELGRLQRQVQQTHHFEELIGKSPPMRRVYDLIDRLGESDASILVTGESGTGKEVVARAIHARSRRSGGPFVAVNCAAMPEALLESELFGHARGAFTDAKTARPGLFAQASGGTLFLDEIGDMPLALQPKLLRVLQEKRVRPVGGDIEVPYDAHIVTATNRDIESSIEDGRFRQDLYFRIDVIRIELPPLRSRGGDVLLLAQHFIERFRAEAGKQVVGLSSAAAERILAYAWPGNVRELSNCIERAVALTRHDQLLPEDLPPRVRDYQSSHVVVVGDDPSELVPLEEVERRYVLRVLESVGWNKSLAARVLKLDRKTLYRKLGHYQTVAPEALKESE